MFIIKVNISNTFNFCSVHEIMNTLVSCNVNMKPYGASLTCQETQSIYDSVNTPKNLIHFLNIDNIEP